MNKITGILVVVALAVIMYLSYNSLGDKVSPSDVICQTYAQCSVGNISFNVGDVVSSPKYSFGFKVGSIILLKNNNSAVIKWDGGSTTTELLTDLNKLKTVGE